MRITGFAEGFDTQAMVSALMGVARTQQQRFDSMAYEQEQKLSAWNSVQSTVGNLRAKVQQVTSLSSWRQMVATSSDESVLTLKAESGAANGSYDIEVSKLAKAHRIAGEAQADTTSALGLSGTFTLGGQQIAVEADASLRDIRDAINLAAGSMADADRVRATIVDTTLVLQRESTGATGIAFSDDDGDVLEALGFLDAGKAIQHELVAPQDLAAKVMGIDIARSSNTVSDVITGATLTVRSEGTSQFTIGRDTGTIRSLINDFIGAYNTTMSALESRSNAPKEANSGASGLLQGDSLLRSIQSRSRSLLTATDDSGTLEPAFSSLRKIGIWTSGKENRLGITDSQAFEDALQNNLDEVEELFRDSGAGVLSKFRDYLDGLTSAVDGTIPRRQATIKQSIANYDKKIAGMERSLAAYEKQLWEQFTTMETAIARLQQQGAYVTSFFETKKSSKS